MSVIRRFRAAVAGIALTVLVMPAVASAAEPAPCHEGHRDEFNGATLDRTRWSKVVREDSTLKVADGSLVLKTTNTDFIFAKGHAYHSPKPTPNIVLQRLPEGAFTATTKMEVRAHAPFQQVGLILYGDDDNYSKLVMVAAPNRSGGSDRVIILVREDEGEPVEYRSQQPLGKEAADTLWLRLTSDGMSLHAFYSLDGENFTEITSEDEVPLGYVDSAPQYIGVLALSGGGTAPVIDAKFDWFEFCPGKK